MSEYLIRGGTIVDGTGAARFQGDLLIRDGRPAAVGADLTTSGQVIDASGLAVTPGLIDPHTHLDGQLFFEPRGTSSCWHGVTTVVMGNCGYSLAPVSPEHREYIIHMFGRVEEVPPQIFRDHLPWDWVTFPEYLDALDRGLGINTVSLVGHSTLRYHVMGPDALRREATADEIQRMRASLREALRAGAFGFSTSLAPTHNDWDGSPVPSRQAAPEEYIALAEELAAQEVGAMGLIPKGLFDGMTPEDKHIILSMARAAGKPIQLNGALGANAWDFMEECAEQGATVYGIIMAQPFYRFFRLRDGTNTFNSMDTWQEIMGQSPEERVKRLADAALRSTLRQEVDREAVMDGTLLRRPRIVWDEMRVSRAARAEHRGAEGRSVREMAEAQGKHLADALLDFAMSDDWDTQFILRFAPEAAWFSDAQAARFNLPHAFPMNSDAGAHLANECRAGEGTFFLRRWVLERNVMSFEEAIRRLTSQAARWIGLKDRGVLRPGMVADVAIFDLERVNALPKEEVNDLPGGARRWIQKAVGVPYVFVNGEPVIQQGEESGALPGRVLRSS